MSVVMAKAKAETEQITVRVSTKLLERLEQLGEPYGLKRSQLVHRAIEEYVQRRDAEQSAPPAQRPKR